MHELVQALKLAERVGIERQFGGTSLISGARRRLEAVKIERLEVLRKLRSVPTVVEIQEALALAEDFQDDSEMSTAVSMARSRMAELEEYARMEAEREAAGVHHLMPERPAEHICPITHDLMRDPVTDALGHSYERVAIEDWFRSGNRTSPASGERLPALTVVPAIALKNLIRAWEKQEHERCMERVQSLAAPGPSRGTTGTLPTDELAARAHRAQAELTRRRQLAAASAEEEEEGDTPPLKQATMETESN